MKPKELKHLGNLLGYFHQDWFEMDPDVQAVVTRWKEDWPEQVAPARNEIALLLEMNLDESDLLRLFTESGCELDPTLEFGSAREWLIVLRSMLE